MSKVNLHSNWFKKNIKRNQKEELKKGIGIKEMIISNPYHTINMIKITKI